MKIIWGTKKLLKILVTQKKKVEIFLETMYLFNPKEQRFFIF